MRKSCPNSLSFSSFCQTGSMKQGDVTSPFYHCLYRVHVKLHYKSPLLENNLHVAQSQAKLLTLPEHMSSPPIFSELRVTRSFALRLVFCRQTFVLLFVFFFFWTLCCLFFFDLGILFTPFDIFKLFLGGSRCKLDLQFYVQCFVDRRLFFCLVFFWPLYCLSFFDLRILITIWER